MHTPTPTPAPQEPRLTSLSHVRELTSLGMVTGASGGNGAVYGQDIGDITAARADGIQLRVN